MLPLSGDHTTSPSGALVLVIRRGALNPSTDTTQRSLTALSVSYEGSNTEYTTHFPSGLTTGAPTRFIIHKASWVIGLVATIGFVAAAGCAAVDWATAASCGTKFGTILHSCHPKIWTVSTTRSSTS
jgi:hypothetical protein